MIEIRPITVDGDLEYRLFLNDAPLEQAVVLSINDVLNSDGKRHVGSGFFEKPAAIFAGDQATSALLVDQRISDFPDVAFLKLSSITENLGPSSMS